MVDFLRALVRHLPQPLLLVWDRLPAHRSRLVRDYISSLGGWIHMEYPASYTVGSLGARVLQAPAILWMQCFATKSWKVGGERPKLSLWLGGHNLPWKRPNLAAPSTTYNLNNTAA